MERDKMSGRPQVTITLGRSRQVVKRTGSMSDIKHTNYATSSGTKRSIRERLGNFVDDPISYDRQYKNKRQQTKDYRQKLSDDDMEEKRYMPSRQVGRNDLRFKLIQKNILKNTSSSHEKHDIDLREKISRNTRGPLKFNHPQHMQESQNSGQSRKIVSARSADDLCRIDTLRKPYSLTSANEQRHRSPDRLVGTSRGMSPPNYLDDAQRVPLLRSSDMLRPTNLTTTKKFTDVLRAEPSSARTAPVYAEASRPVYRASLSSHPVQQTPLKYEDHPSVAGLLHSLGLGKYAILFQAEEVDMPALKQMGDSDLKSLGLPMGPRKKILLALPRPQQQPTHKGN